MICKQKTNTPLRLENLVEVAPPKNSGKPLEKTDFSEADQKRFWSKVKRIDDCWIWTSSKHFKGYGLFYMRGKLNRTLKAHRVSFALENGLCPEKLLICHHCDTPSCVNPQHLFSGTAFDNQRDSVNKGRAACLRDDCKERLNSLKYSPLRLSKIRRGENNHLARLTQEQVSQIRNLLNTYTHQQIADRFRVCRATISLIIEGKTWRPSWGKQPKS